jgi:hypothetical protein
LNRAGILFPSATPYICRIATSGKENNMNASEIDYIEARLPMGLTAMPSPEEMDRLIARAHTERNQHMAASFYAFIGGLKDFAGEVRKIAVACTAARLHAPTV